MVKDSLLVLDTARKMPIYGVFSGPYFPVFGLNTGKYGPEEFSAQWQVQNLISEKIFKIAS